MCYSIGVGPIYHFSTMGFVQIHPYTIYTFQKMQYSRRNIECNKIKVYFTRITFAHWVWAYCFSGVNEVALNIMCKTNLISPHRTGYITTTWYSETKSRACYGTQCIWYDYITWYYTLLELINIYYIANVLKHYPYTHHNPETIPRPPNWCRKW